MYIKIILTLLLFLATSLNAGLFSDDKKKIVLPTHEIFIEGAEVFSESDILEALSADHKSFFEFWKEDKATIKDKLIPSMNQALRAFFDSEGYYDAKFQIKQSKKSIRVLVHEGEPVTVNDINVTSDFDLNEVLEFNKGEIFKAKKFIESKAKIISSLLDEGYCSYELDSKAYVDLDKHTVDLRYKLNKGGVCTFGNVTITGLETIDPEIVKSRVRAKEGERFSKELVQNTSTAIYGLQSFDSVLLGWIESFITLFL